MAENLENPGFGNFSIENTMEMGLGSAELLNDLMGPDTSTADPDDVQKIDVEPTPAPVKKQASTAKADEDVEDKKEEDASKSIQDFLLGGDEDEDEDEAPAPKAAKKEETPAAEEEEEEDTATNQFTALSRDLFKLGVFTKDDDEDDAWEWDEGKHYG
jgi:hypothetical protein